MRDKFLGDSLDMSKRVAVSLLREAGFRLLICPLPSEVDFSETIYRSCLSVDGGDNLFNPEMRFRSNQRKKHLAALRDYLPAWMPEKPGLAILDPDTGVHRSSQSNKFITVHEVNGLVETSSGHVVAVYHHKRAGSISYPELDLKQATYAAIFILKLNCLDEYAACRLISSESDCTRNRLSKAMPDDVRT